MAKKSLFKKRAAWCFKVHADLTKGPNRTLYDPVDTKKFFSRMKASKKAIVVTHIRTNLTMVATTIEEFDSLVNGIIKRVGLDTLGKRYYQPPVL